MEINNKIPNTHEEIKDNEHNNNNDNNNPTKEIGNNSDNEIYTILNKDNKNRTIEIDTVKNTNEQSKKGNNYLHDKDIMEDSIIYFSNKLKQSNEGYKKYLYISIILYIIDIFIWFVNKEILHNLFNLLSLIVILISVIYQVYIFKHNFEIISKDIYDLTQKMIYIYCGIVILFLLNMLYISCMKLFYNNNGDKQHFIDYPLIIFVYITANSYVPSILALKLISVKKCIKNLSAAKGEIYESAKIEEIQIINSIINET